MRKKVGARSFCPSCFTHVILHEIQPSQSLPISSTLLYSTTESTVSPFSFLVCVKRTSGPASSNSLAICSMLAKMTWLAVEGFSWSESSIWRFHLFVPGSPWNIPSNGFTIFLTRDLSVLLENRSKRRKERKIVSFGSFKKTKQNKILSHFGLYFWWEPDPMRLIFSLTFYPWDLCFRSPYHTSLHSL